MGGTPASGGSSSSSQWQPPMLTGTAAKITLELPVMSVQRPGWPLSEAAAPGGGGRGSEQ